METKKRALAAVLAAALALSGCGGAAPSSAAVPAAASAAAPVTLSWYVNYSWFQAGWGENAVSQAITDRTGTAVHFVVPAGSESEKLDALIAADALPDLITLGWWEPQVKTLIERGYVVSLTDLAQKYGSDFLANADQTVLDWYRQRDGEVYCYSNSSFTPQDYKENNNIASTETFLVRRDLYEALGSPDMTTPEGFAGAVREAARRFPAVDGRPLIPLGVHEFNENGCDSFGDYLMNFLAIPREKNGAYYDRTTDPEYLRWLRMFSQLGREGLLANDIFIDKRVQMEEKIAQGRYFCMLYQRTDLAAQQKALYAADPQKSYIAVDGPRNAAGDPHTLPGGGINGWTVTLISSHSQHQKEALALMSFLMSEEGQKLTSVGIEGEDYTLQNGKAVLTPSTRALIERDYPAYLRTRGADNTYWMLQNNCMQMGWRVSDDPALAQMEQWTMPYTVYMGQYEVLLEPDSEAEIADRKIKHAWGRVLPRLLTAADDAEFDRLLQDFLAEREADGYALLAREFTRQIAANKQRLGLA